MHKIALHSYFASLWEDCSRTRKLFLPRFLLLSSQTFSGRNLWRQSRIFTLSAMWRSWLSEQKRFAVEMTFFSTCTISRGPADLGVISGQRIEQQDHAVKATAMVPKKRLFKDTRSLSLLARKANLQKCLARFTFYERLQEKKVPHGDRARL